MRSSSPHFIVQAEDTVRGMLASSTFPSADDLRRLAEGLPFAEDNLDAVGVEARWSYWFIRAFPGSKEDLVRKIGEKRAGAIRDLYELANDRRDAISEAEDEMLQDADYPDPQFDDPNPADPTGELSAGQSFDA